VPYPLAVGQKTRQRRSQVSSFKYGLRHSFNAHLVCCEKTRQRRGIDQIGLEQGKTGEGKKNRSLLGDLVVGQKTTTAFSAAKTNEGKKAKD